MSTRPSRLYRTFKPTSGLFEVVTDTATYTDEQIHSIKITRGSSGPHPTVTPSTAEVRITGALNILRNSDFAIRTTAEFGTALAAYTPIPGGQVRQRFNGRKAIAEIDDERWSHDGTPARWATNVTASSWTTLLRNAARSFTVNAGQRSASAVVAMFRHPDIEPMQPVTYSGLTGFDTVAITEPEQRFDDVMQAYADDLHTLVQHQRSGTVRVISNVARRDSLGGSTPAWTLLRAHTLSPAKWVSPSEVATTQYSVRYSIDGDPYEMEWPLSDEVSVVPLKPETVDLTQINRVTDSLGLIMNAINRTTNISRVGVDSVTLDLGMLWRKGDLSAQRTVAEALRMEAGDLMYLGADWPQGVRGPYFANQIEESITPDEWTITFGLQHARYVLGLGDNQMPVPPAITWDANSVPWNTYPGPWG